MAWAADTLKEAAHGSTLLLIVMLAVTIIAMFITAVVFAKAPGLVRFFIVIIAAVVVAWSFSLLT